MNKIIYPSKIDLEFLLQRPAYDASHILKTIKEVFDSVRKEGDLAIAKYAKQFDHSGLTNFLVSKEALESAQDEIPTPLKQAIQTAKSNIEAFHAAQKTSKILVETMPGVQCWQEKKAIQKVGLYIPGGSAPLFSTILMLAIPAKLAGCKEIILCSPPNSEAELHPAIRYTANLCGLSKVYKLGGIQAIAAMTFGSETIPKVYKIFGPGNQYVTSAKQYATNWGVSIDMPAGPSEVLVAADHTANPAFVAADLLSQAEHGGDSQVILLSTSKSIIDQVEKEIESQLINLDRKEIISKAMTNSKSILVKNDQDAIGIINTYAPEHLILCVDNIAHYLEAVCNAGSVFIGNYTPESAGDYASGTNHTLPTNGYAKQYSGVNLDSFMKSITYQHITAPGIQSIGKTITEMAEAEGLTAHKEAVSIRLRACLKRMQTDHQ